MEGGTMKRIFLLLVLCVVMIMFLAACSEKRNTVKIGVNAEMTGDMPAVGESCKKAAEMAVKEVNDAGGIDIGGQKYKVDLFVEDNAGKPDQSASATQ
jgi:branched-chain amino acid transport system substrate-binding protein